MKTSRLFAKLRAGKDKAFSRATERGRFEEFESVGTHDDLRTLIAKGGRHLVP
jgi:hypothetical protein